MKNLSPTIILKALVGSRLYGLATEESDWDYRYVQVSPLRTVLSPFYQGKIKVTSNATEDNTTWEFRDFLRLAIKGNPSVYEALFSTIIEKPVYFPPVETLLAGRPKLLSKKAIVDAHLGYSGSQLHKMGELSEKGGYSNNPRMRKAAMAYFRVLDQGTQLLRNRSVDPIVRGSLRDWLLELRDNGLPQDHDIFDRELVRAKEAFVTIADTIKDFVPDLEFVEDLNYSAYLEADRRNQP